MPFNVAVDCASAFFATYSEANEETVTEFLAFSTSNPSSIRNCIETARLNARSVRTALTIAAVALGVAVVLAIELAGEAAAGSFRSSVETLAGGGGFEVTATGGVPAAVLARLALLP